jgi:exodeoxyribonuclease-5
MEALPRPFTDAAYRGSLVHTALEQLYSAYRGKKKRPEPEEVPFAVHHALSVQHAEHRLLPAVLAAERHLLEGMLVDWLEYEQSLQVFEIAELEWRATMKFAGFKINVRVDRVDRLEDGRVVLLDYKTGSDTSCSGWGEERLRDVQLPLYATLLRNSGVMEPAGVAFARVRLHETGIQGLGDEPCIQNYHLSGFEHRPPRLARQLGSWSGALDAWDRKISMLMDEFSNGDARHQVYHEAVLKHADLAGLMRSAESFRWLQEQKADGNS